MNTPQFSVPVSHHPSAKRAQTWCQQPTTTTSEVASCCKQEQLTSIMDSVHESFVANAKIDDIKVITRCYQERRSHLPKYLTLLSRSSCHHTLVVLLLLLYLFPVIFLSPQGKFSALNQVNVISMMSLIPHLLQFYSGCFVLLKTQEYWLRLPLSHWMAKRSRWKGQNSEWPGINGNDVTQQNKSPTLSWRRAMQKER